MVLPKNFDNPEEAFALARAYAQHKEQQLLGNGQPVQKQPTEETGKQDD
jgi:hypothetical protein